MKLLIASTNKGKLREFEPLLGNRISLLSPSDPIFSGISPPEIVEDGQTYYENALKKALGYSRVFRMPALSDNSGLEVDVLGGRPGIFSARFGGDDLSWAERWQMLYRHLEPFPKEQWTARFRCVLCFCRASNRVPLFFEGIVEGLIAPRPRGENGFGYDPIFYSNQLSKTFGEATTVEKDLISHRSQAIHQFLASRVLDQV